MATEMENCCPVCLESWEEASYVLPCLHQCCYPCIMQWAESKPECPLCKTRVRSILHSVRADTNFEEQIMQPSAASSVIIFHTGAPRHPAIWIFYDPAAIQPSAAALQPVAPPGSFYVYIWASIFCVYSTVLRCLQPWLHHKLQQLFEVPQEASAAWSLIISSLCCFGLDEEALIQLLQISLGSHTRCVHKLVHTIVQQSSGEAQCQMVLKDAHAVQALKASSEAAPGPTASQGESPAPILALCGCPSRPISKHREQEEPQEDPEEALPGPSTPSWGSQRTPGGHKRAQKRRAGSCENPSQPCRKPPHDQ